MALSPNQWDWLNQVSGASNTQIIDNIESLAEDMWATLQAMEDPIRTGSPDDNLSAISLPANNDRGQLIRAMQPNMRDLMRTLHEARSSNQAPGQITIANEDREATLDNPRAGRPAAVQPGPSSEQVLEAWAAAEEQGEGENQTLGARDNQLTSPPTHLPDGNQAPGQITIANEDREATLDSLGAGRPAAAQPEPSLDQVLDAWVAAEEQGEGEERAEAARRVRSWVAAGNADAPLDLVALNLTSLPPRLPDRLKHLKANTNRLTSLRGAPDGLMYLSASYNQLTSFQDVPAGLQFLEVRNNQFTSFKGAPAGLQHLNIRHNQLTSFQDAPAGLQYLDVRRNRFMSFQGAPASLQELDVSYNQFTSFQGVPDGLETLYAHDNQFTSFQGVPDGLQALHASSNQLTNFQGAPDGLETLDVSDNQFTSFQGVPDGLQTIDISRNRFTGLQGAPDGLRNLDASDNRLTSIEGAPGGLRSFDASFNQVTSVPEDLLTRMAANCTIDLTENPLHERVRTNLLAVMDAPGYAGPRISFSMDGDPEPAATRPLGDAAADWVGDDVEAMAAWQGFAGEDGAPEYARFLDRLRGTVSYGNPEFRQAVVEDLQQAATRPRLREKYFLQAFGATETCEDRVTLTWNGMQTARLTDDVEDGAYDDRLDELVTEARRLLRLDTLDRIAREKVQSLRFVDEIEVYLAYQVKLRERLDLRLVAPDMRYFGVSHVTEDDLDAAEARVRTAEATEFAVYLATKWQPWETVVSRIAPEAYAAMREQLVEAMDEKFQTRLTRRLAEANLTGDADAERELGAKVRDELAREIKGDLMRQVLRDKGLERLLSSGVA